MSTRKDNSPLPPLPEVVRIADAAGARIMAVYDTEFDVEHKHDESPLTAADLASHEAICDGLESLTPDLPVLSEESTGIDYAERRCWRRYWLVDPLDGTREFVKRNGEFTVNIALIDAGIPVLGVVGVPALGRCYFAARGQGAWRRTGDGPTSPIRTRRTSSGAFAVAGSRSHGSGEQERFFAALGANAEVVSMGSALKFCLVAEGRVDIYPRFGPTSEWDTAAAQCVVEEAGGLVTDTRFQPLRYNTRADCLNPHFLATGDPDFNWAPYLSAVTAT